MSEESTNLGPIVEIETEWYQAVIEEEQRLDDEIMAFLETKSPKYQAIKKLLYMFQEKSENSDLAITYSYHKPGKEGGYALLTVEFNKKDIRIETNDRQFTILEWEKDEQEIADSLIKNCRLRTVLIAILSKDNSVKLSLKYA